MDAADALSTIAQLGLALTGFAGLLTVFRHPERAWTKIEHFAVQYLLVASTSAALFALLPMPMLIGGNAPSVTWTLCLPVLAGWLILLLCWSQWQRRRGLRPRWPIPYWSMTVLGFALAAAELAGALYPSLPQPALYVAGLCWLLLLSMLQLLVQILRTLPTPNE